MEGASRTILSQPLAALAPKTASGGKIRARRFAPAWSADKPLYRFGKIRRRAQTRVGARILANIIGNLVADRIAGNGKPENLLMGTPYDGPGDSSNAANLTYEFGVPQNGTDAPLPVDPDYGGGSDTTPFTYNSGSIGQLGLGSVPNYAESSYFGAGFVSEPVGFFDKIGEMCGFFSDDRIPVTLLQVGNDAHNAMKYYARSIGKPWFADVSTAPDGTKFYTILDVLGRPDLGNTLTHYLWEIKPQGLGSAMLATAQAWNYTIHSDPQNMYRVASTAPSFFHDNSLSLSGYFAKYSYKFEGAGAITYKIDKFDSFFYCITSQSPSPNWIPPILRFDPKVIIVPAA